MNKREAIGRAALVITLIVTFASATGQSARGEEPAAPAVTDSAAKDSATKNSSAKDSASKDSASKEPAAKDSTCPRAAFRIVVDVGHTVAVPGADSARGVTEYSFNLKLADVIIKALTDAGFEKTVRLITAMAPHRGLLERADRANAMHADLFLSVHHDSVPDHLIQAWEFEGKKNFYSDRFSGYALFVSNDNADRAGSLAFGHLLGEELQKGGLHFTPHYTLPLMGHYRHQLLDNEAGVYRYDQLVVLRHTKMPAVLMEAGSIVNRQEELELGTPERRALVAKAVTAAAEEFCATRTSVVAARPAKKAPTAHAAAVAKPAALTIRH